MKYITKLGSITDLPATKQDGYDVSYEPLYADGTGRTMNGTFSGTLIGIFPKITATFPIMSQANVRKIIAELKKPIISVTWYDLSSNSFKTSNFYPSPTTAGVAYPKKSLGKELTITLISIKRM